MLDFEKPITDLENKINELRSVENDGHLNLVDEINVLQQKCNKLIAEIYNDLSPWQITQIARHPNRPYTKDYIEEIFTDFYELHGDRQFSDDHAMITGVGRFKGTSVAVIGHQKGRDTNDKIYRNFGMVRPEGFRKSLRVMKLAEKFNMPIITFIDTPGAYPGIDAESRGQSEAIATNLLEMSDLKVPILSYVIGEGGSGGALAIGVCDNLSMLEYSIYSVISPEGCASILYKNAEFASNAAEAMKITANDLRKLNLIDEIISEPLGGAHHNWQFVADNIKKIISKYLSHYAKQKSDTKIVNERYEKFRNIGNFTSKN